MNPIYLHFASFSQEVISKNYIVSALKSLHAYYVKLGGEVTEIENKHQDDLVNLLVESNDLQGLKLIDPSDFPKISEVHMSRVNKMIGCAKEIIDEVAPLMEGEEIVSSTSSYLSEAWKTFGKGCGVISRETNFATVHFLFPNTMVRGDGELNKEAPVFPGSNLTNHQKSELEIDKSNLITQAPFDSLIL